MDPARKSMRVLAVAETVMESLQPRGYESDELIAGAALYASAVARGKGMSREQCVTFVIAAIHAGWE